MRDLGMMPIAEEYIILNVPFMSTVKLDRIVRIAKLIKKHGADVNYTRLDTNSEKQGEEVFTPLRYAVRNSDIDAVKFIFFNSGANPNYILNGKKAIDYATNPEIKDLLCNAMEKWQK